MDLLKVARSCSKLLEAQRELGVAKVVSSTIVQLLYDLQRLCAIALSTLAQVVGMLSAICQ